MGSRPDGILNRKQAETIKRIAIDSTSIFGQFQLNISDGDLKIFQSLDGSVNIGRIRDAQIRKEHYISIGDFSRAYGLCAVNKRLERMTTIQGNIL
jgi:hypothetical protein